MIRIRGFVNRQEYLYLVPLDVWELLGLQSKNIQDLRILLHNHPAVGRRRVWTVAARYRDKKRAMAAAAGR